MVRNTFTVFVVIIMVLSLTSISYAGGAGDSEIERKTVIDSDGIIYDAFFSAADSKVRVSVNNPTERNREHTGYSIIIDGQRVYDADFRLDRNEQRTEKVNITSGIDVTRDEHTVTFSTYGNSTQFDFTREINSADPGEIPTPYISNVEVEDGIINGEPSAVANVTLVNPSKQLYSTKLMVHTAETDGSLYPASVRPESSRTITVELLDDRGAEIAGEARLYTGNMTTREGAMDQVEFAGQAGEQTQVWNKSYEPARPTWMKDNYEYQNESYSHGLAEKASGGHEIGGVPIIYAAVALLVGWIAVRKYR